MLSPGHASEVVLMRAMLRKATSSLHESVERRLAPLMQASSIDAYRDFLLAESGS